jgi:23S rRNA (uracil1939-C5)-methyltransferase
MKTDTDIELTIEALGARGDGLASFEGERVIVPLAVPGDRVKARLSRDKEGRLLGRVRAVVAPGPARAAPPCRHFGDHPAGGCGGCALQHLEAEAYRAWKLAQLEAALARHDVKPEAIEPLADSPPASRRRADFTASRKKDGVVLGFNARGSHRVVDLAECAVLRPALVALLEPLRELLAPLMKPGDSAEARLAATDSGADLLLVSAIEMGVGARERVASFATRHDVARVARAHPKHPGTETLIERRPVRMVMGGVPVPLPPGAFLQATAEGEAALRDFVVAAAAGARRVADLYSGVGTFAFPVAAAGAKVHAIDAGKAEIAAIEAAARAAVLAGVTAEARDLDKRPLDAGALGAFDAVVFDPPRAGAAAQAAALASSKIGRVIAVSCNPGTFARDARTLIDGGFRLVRLKPVDQFRWSTHLELAGLFLR